MGGGLGEARRVMGAKQKHDPYHRRNISEGFHQAANLKQVTRTTAENAAERYDAGIVVNSDTRPQSAAISGGLGFDRV